MLLFPSVFEIFNIVHMLLESWNGILSSWFLRGLRKNILLKPGMIKYMVVYFVQELANVYESVEVIDINIICLFLIALGLRYGSENTKLS